LKRVILCLAMGAGLISACSDTQAVLTSAGLSGTYDLAIVDRYVFVTSSDRNELRVLDLEGDPRGFLRAPNPLESLSVPVLERPTYLARDVDYLLVDKKELNDKNEEVLIAARGQEVVGPYVYARSDGAQEISVVSASASEERNLRELHRLRGLGFVTAFAGRGSVENRPQSILYYATQDAANATIWKQRLPKPDELTRSSTLPAREVVATLPAETVTALLVLPANRPDQSDPTTEQEYIVVATRGTQGGAGRTFRMDANHPQDPIVTYMFGAPVRLLATHPVVADTSFGGDVDRPDPNPPKEDPNRIIKGCGIDTTQPPRSSLRAGEYVYAVLDESFCGGGTECSGVLAVDSATGMVPLDSTGYPMISIRTGGGLPTGLALMPGGRVQIRCTENRFDLQQRPLVGIFPSTDGQITLFDAAKLRSFNFITTGPSSSVPSFTDSQGNAKDLKARKPETFLTAQLLSGATRSDTYRFVNQGPLPPPRRRNFSVATNCAGGAGCAFEVGSADEARFVLNKDTIVLEGEGVPCLLTVTTKDESVPNRVRLLTEPIPEACDDPTRFTRFSLRAGPESGASFVVYSEFRGFEGRMAVGQTLEIAGDYLFHPVGFTNQQPVFRARLNLLNFVEPLEAGDQYVIGVGSGFQPYVFAPDTGSLASGLGAYRLPGPVSHTRVNDVDYAYIAYPSADGILEVNLAFMTDNAALTTGLVPFE
jgi:hypothetical protein